MTLMSRHPLHVAQISFFSDPEGRSPIDLLREWPTLSAVAEDASRAGVRVSLVQASIHAQHLTRNSVDYYFLPFGEGSGSNAGTPLDGLLPALAADVFHVHGLDFPREVLALAALVPGVPIVLQDHASRLPPLWRRAAWRRGMAAVTAITFCAAEQARPFAGAGLLRPGTRVYEIPGSTCRFAPGGREEARRQTALAGDPAVLWVGHLRVDDGMRSTVRRHFERELSFDALGWKLASMYAEVIGRELRRSIARCAPQHA
jgi:hypothetical protein